MITVTPERFAKLEARVKVLELSKRVTTLEVGQAELVQKFTVLETSQAELSEKVTTFITKSTETQESIAAQLNDLTLLVKTALAR
ncbi:hypothetical protein [Sinosporangium siamense]|uniref:Uncharacterized protein n=1 Tax=Sinosporangium siamense TaxID=1367973 RepID=A0A919RL03_9ACTN|nr:hypothetical protein [Sinosporangium siamense]GII94016.1 hypothetical protein Ssi02_42470 [Sinosporangium siamense]